MARDLRDYNKAYYAKNKETRKVEVRARQKEISVYVQKYKLARGCSICGYNKSARALEFHHTEDNKSHDIARMVAQGRALSSILTEIEKCVIVCSNCHAELHDMGISSSGEEN